MLYCDYMNKFSIPQNIEDRLFFSKQAGSFSGVPQRTVQSWSEKGLLSAAEDTTGGTGNRRKYNVWNCIQIAIIKALADGRVRLETIAGIMNDLDSNAPGGLPFYLSYEKSYLIIQFSTDQSFNVLYDYFNSDIDDSKKIDMYNMTYNSEIEKTIVLDLKQITRKVLSQVK